MILEIVIKDGKYFNWLLRIYWYAFVKESFEDDYEVLGLDNMNDYYSTTKKERLKILLNTKTLFMNVDISTLSILSPIFESLNLIKL